MTSTMPRAWTKINQAVLHLKAAAKSVATANEILSGGPADYYLTKLGEYVEALFGRFAPFHVGDMVQITTAPNTDNDWRAYREYLQPGCSGLVIEVDYRDGLFTALVKLPVGESSEACFQLSESYLTICGSQLKDEL